MAEEASSIRSMEGYSEGGDTGAGRGDRRAAEQSKASEPMEEFNLKALNHMRIMEKWNTKEKRKKYKCH